MRTCYLIFCHTDSTSVLRLVRRIRALSTSSDVVVRFEDPDFLEPASVSAAGALPLVSSTEARWGAWSLVEAMIEALRFGLERTDAERFVIVSGQCYPIRDLSTWERELEAQQVDAILDSIPDHPKDHHYRWSIVSFPPLPAMVRRLVWHMGWRMGQLTEPRLQVFPRFAGGLSERRWWIGTPRRNYSGSAPGGIRIKKAATWMMLSRRAAERALARMDHDDRLIDFFRTVRIPDESTLQSLLADDTGLNVHEGVISAKRFPAGVSSPVWLDVTELEQHLGSGAPFVRKIPPNCDERIIQFADSGAEESR